MGRPPRVNSVFVQLRFFDLIRFDTLNWIYNRLCNDNIIKDRMLAGLWPFAIWAHCFEGNFHAPSVFFFFLFGYRGWISLYLAASSSLSRPSDNDVIMCRYCSISLCVVGRQKGKKYYRCLNNSIASWSENGISRGIGFGWLVMNEPSSMERPSFPLEYLQPTPKSQRSKLVGLKRRSSLFERLCVHLSSQTQEWAHL